MDRQTLIDYAYGIATKYGEASAALSAQMYDAVAELSGASVPAAVPAETASYSEVAKTVNGVIKRTGSESVLTQEVGKLVKKAGADTTLKNAYRDRPKRRSSKRRHSGAQVAWIPSGDTCPFCLTLASNGWQNQTEWGANNHAEHIHANCDCTYAVRFDSDFSVDGYDPDEYKKMYDEAEGSTPNEKINSMRRDQYAQNRDRINAQKRAAYAVRKTENSVLVASSRADAWANSIPADARDNYAEIIKRGTNPMQKGFSCFGDTPEDKLLTIRASKIEPKEGFFDVAMHGDVNVVCFGTNKPNMSPRTLANIIKSNPDYHGEKIRLFCCKTGQTDMLEDWQYCFAEELSNNLGVIVEAPDDLLYIMSDGDWYVGRSRKKELIPFTPNQKGRYK